MEQFIKELAELCKKHNGHIYYTNEDDGLHVTNGKESLCIGYNPQEPKVEPEAK